MLVPEESFHVIPYSNENSIKECDLLAVQEDVGRMKSQQSGRNSRSAAAAVVWERKSSGYRIVDLGLDKFMQALRFVLDNFCETEPVCKAVRLHNDAVSVRSFMSIVLSKMNELISLCALEEGTEKMVGVLIASTILKKHPRRMKIELHQGDALGEITLLKSYAIAKALFYETLNADKIVSLDILCVTSDHQKRGIGTALVRSCVTRAVASACACVGEITSGAGQTIANRLGFETVFEIPYKHLGWKDNRFQIFESCYPENYSLACMALLVTPLRREQSISPDPAPTKEPVKKRSKPKKRKLKNR